MSKETIIQPKRPDSPEWMLYDYRPNMGYTAERWISVHGHVAITAVEVANDPGQEPLGPEYHVSFSKNGQRVSADEIPELLKLFDMEGADEDNHVSGGIARNYWKPVAERLIGIVCPCKKEEPAVIEGDYVWRPLDAK